MWELDYESRLRLMRLEGRVESLFEKYEFLTLSFIKNDLFQNGFDYQEEELRYVMNFLLVDRGEIIKKDFWDKEPVYIRLEARRVASSFSKHYYSFEVDNYETKKFLLISDTHIGNDRMEDFLLIDKVYEYAIGKGATKCFHLGDLFDGNLEPENFSLEEKLVQIMRFIDYYPRPLPTEMMTYANQGNHDKQIDSEYWHCGYSNFYYDLRQLQFFNPSFYMFPRDRWTTEFLDKKFHFGHKFYQSMLNLNLKVTCAEDLLEKQRWLEPSYDVHVSGHLHKGLIYGAQSALVNEKDLLFLGVPSTSKLNLNSAIAYLVTLNYKNGKVVTDMDISVLSCDNNYNIFELDKIPWNFHQSNDVYKKVKIFK